MTLMRGRTEIEIENPLLSEQSKAALKHYLTYYESDLLIEPIDVPLEKTNDHL